MQLLHFGLLRMPVAENWDYEEIPLSFFKRQPKQRDSTTIARKTTHCALKKKFLP